MSWSSAAGRGARRPGRGWPKPASACCCSNAVIPAARAGQPVRGPVSRDYPYLGAARAAYPAALRRSGTAGAASVSLADGRSAHPGRARPGHPGLGVHPVRPGGRVPVPGRGQGGRGMGGDPAGPGRASQPDADDADQGRRLLRAARPFRDRRGGDAAGRLLFGLHGRHCGAVGRSHLVGGAAAGLGQRQASARPGQFVRSGRADYMRHNNLALVAFSREPNPTAFQKTLAINDFYGPGPDWPYPMAASTCSASPTTGRSRGRHRICSAGLLPPRTARWPGTHRLLAVQRGPPGWLAAGSRCGATRDPAGTAAGQ